MNAMGEVLGLLCAKHDSNAPSAVLIPLPLSLFSTGLEERTYPICHSSWYLFISPLNNREQPPRSHITQFWGRYFAATGIYQEGRGLLPMLMNR